MGFEASEHARQMLEERQIPDEWMWRTVTCPERIETAADGNTHFIKSIPEHGGRLLRVVVNQSVSPYRIVTLFFDRRLLRRQL